MAAGTRAQAEEYLAEHYAHCRECGAANTLRIEEQDRGHDRESGERLAPRRQAYAACSGVAARVDHLFDPVLLSRSRHDDEYIGELVEG